MFLDVIKIYYTTPRNLLYGNFEIIIAKRYDNLWLYGLLDLVYGYKNFGETFSVFWLSKRANHPENRDRNLLRILASPVPIYMSLYTRTLILLDVISSTYRT